MIKLRSLVLIKPVIVGALDLDTFDSAKFEAVLDEERSRILVRRRNQRAGDEARVFSVPLANVAMYEEDPDAKRAAKGKPVEPSAA